MKLADRFNYLFMLRTCWRLADLRERQMLIGIYVAFIVGNCFALTEPLIMAHMVSAITLGGQGIFVRLIKWSVVWLCVAVMFWIFHGTGRLLERRLGYGLRSNLTRQLYHKVTHMSWAWHQNNHSGDVLNRVNLATVAIYEFADNQYQIIQLAMRIGGSIAILLWIAPSAGLIMAVALPLLTLLFSKFDVVIAKLSRQQAKTEGEIAASLTDYLGNIATVLTLRLQQASGREIMRRIAGLRTTILRAAFINESKWMAFGLCLRTIQAAALISFVWQGRNIDSAIMAGTAVAILQYLGQVGSSFMNAANVFQTMIRSRVNIENAELISGPLKRAASFPITTTWRTARIDNLAFSYEDREHHAHHLEVSLELARGRRIALVGTSGSGKSTLLRLLRGLHDAEAGTLTVDGAVYQGIAPLADLSTLVPQDPEIFENTIRYNITCGIAEDETALTAAIHAAALESVIAELPQGLDTDIRERGVNLSGGQKQRLALARGILAARDSSLILLDEPTSSLDAATESIVFDRLLGMYGQACIVASLHRLHLLERFDYVYVMEAGRIVEQGDFTTLVGAGGVLTHLWKAQQAERAD
jgi:ABC-type multidrug transport system fused ATPase/permease subunit